MKPSETFRPAPAADRAAALAAALTERGLLDDGFVEAFTRTAEETWVTANGARSMWRKLGSLRPTGRAPRSARFRSGCRP